MKKQRKALYYASKFALPILVLVILSSIATLFAVKATTELFKNGTTGWTGSPVQTLFNYKMFSGHDAFMRGQILNNLVAYFFIFGGIALFVLSFIFVKHDNKLKIKSAIIALCLFIPATLGGAGGIIDFLGHGVKVCLASGGKGAVCAFLVIITFVLDILYFAAAVVYLIYSIKTTVKVNKGELSAEEATSIFVEDDGTTVVYQGLSEEEKQKKLEEKAARRAQLLEEIRKIVREELDKLDRVAIVKEAAPVHVAAAPAPVAQTEEEKKAAAARIPFAQKMVKADKEIQDKYNELKNELLAYGATSRVSIAGDTFRLHRKAYVKITLVGKTLKVYFALDPKQFDESPIPVISAKDVAVYEDVPSCLKVKSNLSVKRAKDLAAMAFAADGVVKAGEAQEHNWIKDLRAELRNKK